MRDLINRQEAIEILRKAKDKSEAHRMLVQLAPVDAVPVAPELEAVVEELNATFACAKNQMWIRNPVLWSLYQVWKDCGGREDGDDDQKE